MQTEKRYQLLVFDWDGTLMDSQARIVACIRAGFADCGLQPPTREAAADIIGLGLDAAMARLLPGGTQAQITAVGTAYRRHFLGEDPTPTELFADAAQTLERLESQGYLLAVATGKSRVGLERSLDETGLRQRFIATRCADETFSKPHPQMLIELMDELCVAPRQTLMIGDTEYDMQMAANAGAAGLAVCHGVHDRARLIACSALDCLESLPEIPDWLAAHAVRSGD